MAELFTTEEIADVFEDTGGVPVSFGGRSTYGHFEHVPEMAGEDVGVVGSMASVVIPSGALPGICLDDGAGSVQGVNERITVGDYDWHVRGLEPGEAPGEMRVLLTNRQSSG